MTITVKGEARALVLGCRGPAGTRARRYHPQVARPMSGPQSDLRPIPT